MKLLLPMAAALFLLQACDRAPRSPEASVPKTETAESEFAFAEVDITTLSAAYLGGVSWHDLAVAGALTATDNALDHLDTLFAVRPAPFCGTGY